ncbi:MAG TPA: hypothetical protein VIG07_02825 [Methylomirabilota bacterium]|jgi:hypothetical protein
MRKSCVLSLLTLTIMFGLVGLLALTSESVHHLSDPPRSTTEAVRSSVTPPVEPETGPVFQRNGLMLTY